MVALVFDSAPVKVCGVGNFLQVERYGSLKKLLRVTAYILRFLDLFPRKVKRNYAIGVDEIEKGLKLWVKYEQKIVMADKEFSNKNMQLSLFFDDEGILRLKGRLENSHLPYEAKHPIFIDHRSYFTRLVILDAHEKVKHMRTKGLSMKFVLDFILAAVNLQSLQLSRVVLHVNMFLLHLLLVFLLQIYQSIEFHTKLRLQMWELIMLDLYLLRMYTQMIHQCTKHGFVY